MKSYEKVLVFDCWFDDEMDLRQNGFDVFRIVNRLL